MAATMEDRIRQRNEEKVRFERTLEEMGFERLNNIKFSGKSHDDNKSNGNGSKNNSIRGFTANNGYDLELYTQTFIRDPQNQYSNKPKICLELQICEGIGSVISIHSIPWMPHYSLNVPGTINRKEVLKLLREYIKTSKL